MKKDTWSTIILIIVLIAGLSLLLYPSFSDWWNSRHQTRAVATYVEEVANLDDDKYAQIWNNAVAYNLTIPKRDNPYYLPDAQRPDYESNLNIGGDGIMGYISIPKIDVFCPIYHGTEETVLQIAIGHLDWTSLPVGGKSTHCVVSGHRGLPSARLFTDLDNLTEGDLFMLNVLDEVLTYQVDQIKIVLPYETEDLRIEEGKDYCTLVTCTPYGINSHRMLVRGTRVGNVEEAKEIRVTADAVQIEPVLVAPVLAVPPLLILLLILLLPKPRKKR